MKTYCDKAKVFVVIPNKNGIAHLSYSLPSLERSTYSNYSIILIDDYSTDDSVNFVGLHYPCVKVLTNNRKKGFAGAVNTGIAYALERGADYIAVFNSDIKVLPEWIALVVDVFKKKKLIGLVGFTEVPKEEGDSFHAWDIDDEVKYEEVRGLSGCLYLCPSQVFRHIGLFDEDYYMYGEDNDLFARLTKAGYIILQTNVPVWHYGEGSGQNVKLYNTWLTYRNALRFSIKNEKPLMILRMFLALLNQACNPFLKRTSKVPALKRTRRYNIVFGFGLVVVSLCWNILHIHRTLHARIEGDRRLAQSCGEE